MNTVQQLISAGFALAALGTAAVPALAWTVWPDVDFEWYANVGKPVATTSSAPITAPATAGRNDLIAPGLGESITASPRLPQRPPSRVARTDPFANDATAAAEPADRSSFATPEGYPPDPERR